MAGTSIFSLRGRGRTSDTLEQPPAAIVPTPSASERRLRLVVESAPVSLCILDPESKILAANQATLALLGFERLQAVIGTPFDRLVSTESRESFSVFVASVCGGQEGTIQYELTALDGASRRLETHAVPLRREANAPAAFLGVTWDVGEKKHTADAMQQLRQEVKQLEAQGSAERESLEEALCRARETQEDESTGRMRVQASLMDAEEQHRRLTAEWNGERITLSGKLTSAEERCEVLAAQLLNDQTAQRASLEDAERKYQTSLAAHSDAHEQIARTLEERTAERDTLEEAVKLAKSTYDVGAADRNRMQATLAELEERGGRQAAEWASERDELLARLMASEHAQREHEGSREARSQENEQLKQALHEARTSFGEMLAGSHAECDGLTKRIQDLQRQTEAVEQWQTELAGALCPLKDVSARVDRLLSDARNAGGAFGNSWPGAAETPEQLVGLSAEASSDPQPDDEASWF